MLFRNRVATVHRVYHMYISLGRHSSWLTSEAKKAKTCAKIYKLCAMFSTAKFGWPANNNSDLSKLVEKFLKGVKHYCIIRLCSHSIFPYDWHIQYCAVRGGSFHKNLITNL